MPSDNSVKVPTQPWTTHYVQATISVQAAARRACTSRQTRKSPLTPRAPHHPPPTLLSLSAPPAWMPNRLSLTGMDMDTPPCISSFDRLTGPDPVRVYYPIVLGVGLFLSFYFFLLFCRRPEEYCVDDAFDFFVGFCSTCL